MTGRTVLWDIALSEIHKRPLFGIGYSGFWLQGNLLAESIWRHFSIESRMGFHFHDTFLEVAVELGWVGVAALTMTLVLAVQRMVRLALADQTVATASLVAALFCLVTRTFDEVDAPYPFAVGTFFLFVIAAYGALDVAWGDVHKIVLVTHDPTFQLPPIPLTDAQQSGADDPFGPLRVVFRFPAPFGIPQFWAYSGDGYVQLVEFAKEGAQAQALLGYGNASRPGSPHVIDQLKYFEKKILRAVYRTRAEVEKHKVSREVVN